MHSRLILVAGLALAGCTTRSVAGADTVAARADAIRSDSIAVARQDSINRATPSSVVDSLMPADEEARRFRAAAPGDSATQLTGGAASREALVQRFVRSLAAADTAALRAMAVTPREFVDIYYPGSLYAGGPYHQPVGFAWRMIQNPSEAGLRKLLRRFGGHPSTLVWQRCEPRVAHEGRVERYTGCLVHFRDESGDTTTRRLFGSIVSYRGQYKFLSYTNAI